MVDEKRAIELTNLIHGHIGIYSILGAKMGVHALDLFEASGIEGRPVIVSYAGSVPPVSCFNDGLQISTGSTLGRGLISVALDVEPRAEATFTCGGKTLHLRLKPSYEAQIQADIRRAVELYGHGPEYWQHVESLALRYSAEWDRGEIFERKFISLRETN